MKDEFKYIIVKSKKNNTYKFALAKFLLDYSKKNTIDDKVTYDTIAKNFLKYYWILNFKYKLKQDFNKGKKNPCVINLLKEVCNSKNIYDEYENCIKNRELKLIRDVAKECLNDVIPRFQRDERDIFYIHNHRNNQDKLSEEERYIILKKEALIFFNKNYDELSKELVTEWANFLNKINNDFDIEELENILEKI